MLFSCALCNYITKRKYDLKRHQTARHNENALNIQNEEKTIQNKEKTIHNSCLIKHNGEWKITNLDNLSNKLIEKNSHEISKYYDNKIKNVDLIEYISKRFDYIDLCLPTTKNVYNQIKYEIKDIIKTSQLV